MLGQKSKKSLCARKRLHIWNPRTCACENVNI